MAVLDYTHSDLWRFCIRAPPCFRLYVFSLDMSRSNSLRFRSRSSSNSSLDGTRMPLRFLLTLTPPLFNLPDSPTLNAFQLDAIRARIMRGRGQFVISFMFFSDSHDDHLQCTQKSPADSIINGTFLLSDIASLAPIIYSISAKKPQHFRIDSASKPHEIILCRQQYATSQQASVLPLPFEPHNTAFLHAIQRLSCPRLLLHRRAIHV